MDNGDHDSDGGEYSTPEGDEYSLPLPETLPADATMESIDPIIPANPQEHVGPSLANRANEDNDNQEEKEMIEPKPPLIVRVIKDDDLSSFEKKTMWVAWCGFGVAVLSFVVTILSLAAACIAGYFVYQQWQTMNGQWETMNEQTKYMNEQTGYMNRAAVQARNDSIANEKSTAKQLAAMQSQVEVMRDADRPWIDVDIQITSPLTFDGKAVRIEFTFIPSDVGRSPAQNVSIIPILTPSFLGDDLRGVQKRTCSDSASKYGMGSLKYVLFQGHHYSQPVGLDMPVKDLDAHWGKLPPGMASPDPIGIAVVGCVDYTYESSSRLHQTAFVYDVLMKDGRLPLKSRTPIAPGDLILRAHPVDSHYPN